ncbi:glutathione synthase [Shewanella insulae]|uniref:Glutathione synthetase n=1 Tax=Shewanella insulae TaxID=2681496 RepID=A0A6L7I0U9_9GAMM|nr:glutathione synthase [Shewanella insulae]MCG9711940.1 glutathione synthase [Shewanella insulae]MCG9740221.1 glutathione synthase [Shewanella insulae]MCG9756303.1 glutathione synthase [Shewanella insulae]MXR70189.1 glutathione synthase [Shewanella insulae]
MHICFLMYPWERIDPESDTTLRLVHECAQRGHTVAITTTSGLTIRDSSVYGFCQIIKKGMKISDNIPRFYRTAEFHKARLPMAGFDCIFMRANPPLDNLALNFLDSVKGDTLIINDLEGLRVANNKLYTASMSGAASRYIPTTHVSKNRDYLQRVLEESDSDKMILKPLNGFGGHGVIVIEKSARQNFSSLLDFYIGTDEQSNYVILQDYIEGAEEGDKRILMLNGEPIGAMRRVPANGEFRSNVHAGGSVVRHTITREERELCAAIGPKLVRDGLYFTGLDVIGNKLVEVNVLSPGGITRINKLNRVRLQKQVIDFAENIINSKELLMQRKSAYRQAVENANL